MPRPQVGAVPELPLLRADAQRNRELVLRVARQRLLAGDSGLSLNALARACGIGVGTVYRHFPTREALLEALALEGIERMLGSVDEIVATPDPMDGLAELLRTALHAQLEDPALAAVMELPDVTQPEVHALSRRLWQAGNDLVDRAKVQGQLRTDLGPDDLRRLLSGLVRAVQAGVVDDPVTDRYLTILLQGLRPPGC